MKGYAGLVSRLAALGVDIATLLVLETAVRMLPPVAWRELIGRPVPFVFTAIVGVVATLLPWAYFTFCWWLNGQTLGNGLLGIVVLSRTGTSLTLPVAAIRAGLGLLLAPLWLIGMVGVLGDDQRRAWHDRVLRTVVRYAR